MSKIKTGNGWPHDVTEADLEITHYKGTGAGGQKKNKTSSGVRMKHIPTGLVAKCDEHRQQSKNKQVAFKKLAELLVPLMRNEVKRERYSGSQERVRTYNKPDKRVKDERLAQIFDYDETISGDVFDEIVNLLIITDNLERNGR